MVSSLHLSHPKGLPSIASRPRVVVANVHALLDRDTRGGMASIAEFPSNRLSIDRAAMDHSVGLAAAGVPGRTIEADALDGLTRSTCHEVSRGASPGLRKILRYGSFFEPSCGVVDHQEARLSTSPTTLAGRFDEIYILHASWLHPHVATAQPLRGGSLRILPIRS